MKLFENPVPPEVLRAALEEGWSEDVLTAGYSESESDCETILPGTLVVERIDALMMYDDDFYASRQAELDGSFSFINDIPDLEKGLYIDSPENRKAVLDALATHPEFRLSAVAKVHPAFIRGLIENFNGLEKNHPDLFEDGQAFAAYRGYANELSILLPS